MNHRTVYDSFTDEFKSNIMSWNEFIYGKFVHMSNEALLRNKIFRKFGRPRVTLWKSEKIWSTKNLSKSEKNIFLKFVKTPKYRVYMSNEALLRNKIFRKFGRPRVTIWKSEKIWSNKNFVKIWEKYFFEIR